MKTITYKQFLVVQHVNSVALVNPYTETTRPVKSVQAAKWRITRAITLQARMHHVAAMVRGLTT